MRFYCYIFLLLFFAGCSAKQSLESGNYDTAVKRAVSKLQKNPYHSKSLNVLEAAYNKAQADDLAEIKRLKQQGNPANWDRIFTKYKGIIKRQTLAKSVEFKPPNITFIDYKNEFEQARTEATNYHFAMGKKYLANGKENRFDARKAYSEFQTVEGYQGKGYKDTGTLKSKARNLGMTYVLYRYENATNLPTPVGVRQQLANLPVGKQNSFWVNYHTEEKENTEYHYLAMLKLNNLAVSPEKIREIERVESREITKLQVQYDDEGKVMRDSTGKAIKVKVVEVIFCNVVEVHLAKSAIMSGPLHIVDVANENYIKTQPVNAETIFDHRFAKAFGNIDALSPVTLDLLKVGDAPFPADGMMIEDAAAILGQQTMQALAGCSSAIQ